MFVFTSVMVTVPPGSARPDESTMLPSSAPVTACASTTRAHVRTSAAADTLLTSVRPRRRSMSHPPYRQPTSNERSPCERRTPNVDTTKVTKDTKITKDTKKTWFLFVFFAFFRAFVAHVERFLLSGPTPRRQFPNSDIAEGHLVAVVLQQDVPLQLGSPSRLIFEFAPGFRSHERRALQLVLDHLDAVQPVLDVQAVHDDASRVELAGGLQGLVGGRRDGIIKRCGGAVRSDAGVRVAGIVYHLVLVRDRTAAILGHEVFHAAVAAGRDFPFEPEIEIVERVDGDDVAAAGRVLALGGKVLEPSVLDHPSMLRKRGLLEAAPAVGGLAVEERTLPGNRLSRQRHAGEDQSDR